MKSRTKDGTIIWRRWMTIMVIWSLKKLINQSHCWSQELKKMDRENDCMSQNVSINQQKVRMYLYIYTHIQCHSHIILQCPLLAVCPEMHSMNHRIIWSMVVNVAYVSVFIISFKCCSSCMPETSTVRELHIKQDLFIHFPAFVPCW